MVSIEAERDRRLERKARASGEEVMNQVSPATATEERPVAIPVEAYTSEAYARAEGDKLWGKVWQPACRVEEIPKVGDYVTYDIMDESIIVVRTAADKIQAHYNVCQHRGRRLTEGCGHTAQFYCRFHGWRWDLNGDNAYVLDPEDWGTALNPDNLRLKTVKVDTWGGWVWINMDPESGPLKDYLEPAVSLLDAFELDKMRFRWRKWLHFPSNWKVALEAFNESYHSDASHPQLLRLGSMNWWCQAENHCAWHGAAGLRYFPGMTGGNVSLGGARAMEGQDARITAAEHHNDMVATLDATTTETLVRVANRLVNDLPEGTPTDEVNAYLMETAAKEDAARGVVWPEISPERWAAVGHDWHIFPNLVMLIGPTFALVYRARPDGTNPDSCIFEVCVIERFPEGEEPKTEWLHVPDPTEEAWKLILFQDFSNMGAVQKGMKSRGYVGARPSPKQELSVIHFHRTLAKYMGTGAPEPIG
jgi:phenylpropionate dioxygenase-like ring-hydroxylating dioxygenase large terminal subunit